MFSKKTIIIYLSKLSRYRANTQVFKRAARLLTHDWIVAVYAVFFVFQLVWAPVTLVVTPGDEFCAEAETSLYQFMIVAPYLLIVKFVFIFYILFCSRRVHFFLKKILIKKNIDFIVGVFNWIFCQFIM